MTNIIETLDRRELEEFLQSIETNERIPNVMEYHVNGTFTQENYERIADLKKSEKHLTVKDWNDYQDLIRIAIGMYYRKTCIIFATRRISSSESQGTSINVLMRELIENPFANEKLEDIMQDAYIRMYDKFVEGFDEKDFAKTVISCLSAALYYIYKINDFLTEEYKKSVKEKEMETEYARIYGMRVAVEKFKYNELIGMKELIAFEGELNNKQYKFRKRMKEKIEKLEKENQIALSAYVGLTGKRQILADKQYYLYQTDSKYRKLYDEAKRLIHNKKQGTNEYKYIAQQLRTMEGR